MSKQVTMSVFSYVTERAVRMPIDEAAALVRKSPFPVSRAGVDGLVKREDGRVVYEIYDYRKLEKYMESEEPSVA